MIFAAFNKLDVYNTGLENFMSANTSEKKGLIVVSQTKKEARNLLEQEYVGNENIQLISTKDLGLIKALKTVRSLSPDIIHAHHNKAVLTSILITIFKKTSLITTIHSNYKHYPLITKISFLLGMLASTKIVCN